jgi:hypothetical protein
VSPIRDERVPIGISRVRCCSRPTLDHSANGNALPSIYGKRGANCVANNNA